MYIGQIYIPLQTDNEPKSDDVIVLETKYGTFRTTVVGCRVVAHEWLDPTGMWIDSRTE